MKGKISVIMPVFNNEKLVANAIKSILNQTYNDIELLIADDGSTDESKRIIDSFKDPRIKVFHNEFNKGALYTWNKLFEMSTGEFITFQDADDVSDLSRLEKQIIKFDEIKGLGICGTFASYYDEMGNFLRDKKLSIEHSDIYKGLEKNHQFCGASIMISKEVLEEVGNYPKYFDRIGGEDYYWSAMIVEKFKSYNIPEPLYFVTTSNNSISRSIKSIKQLIVFDIIKSLIRDVRNGKSNWIKENKIDIIEEYEKFYLKPYIDDPSLVFRKQAYIESNNKNYSKAIGFVLMAVLKNPLLIINYKILVYNFLALIKR